VKRYDRIVLFVQERNVPAIRIYERLGFTRSGALLQAYV
jgi:ribosomal protein S18 acetylase RimI-like enzyme